MSTQASRIEGGEHVLSIRVYYEDTDAAGIVYYANYLKYAERARTEMLRLMGVEQSELAQSHGLAFAVRNCAIDYQRPAKLDDLLEVRSHLRALAFRPLHSILATGWCVRAARCWTRNRTHWRSHAWRRPFAMLTCASCRDSSRAASANAASCSVAAAPTFRRCSSRANWRTPVTLCAANC